MKLRTKSTQGLRSNPLAGHRATTEPLVLPTQGDEQADAYTWAVNAALESGQTEAAYEIAAGFRA
ncbi:MAG: hypothetical protein QOF39_3544 [Frankiales bacterium]|jgi:hypothetical protein|nr:hypothetical protein [Frankiales bacterium]